MTVNAGTNTQELRFGEPRASTNQRVTFPGGPTDASGVFQVPWPSGQAAVTFTLSQQTLGQPATAQFVVRRSGCPDWPTLAGGGTTAFGSPTATATLSATTTSSTTATPSPTATRTPTNTATPTRTPTAISTPVPPCVGAGNVCAWGYNFNGQIGDGTVGTNRLTPVRVSGLSNVVAIAAGQFDSMALLADGTVRAWGFNGTGQLGDGTNTQRLTPVSVGDGLNGVRAIGPGDAHSVALFVNGTASAWGLNGNGQLGDGTQVLRFNPAPVVGLSGARALSVGGNHNLALLADGTVRAWGLNTNGQVGDGTNTDRWTPVPVSSLSGVRTLGAGQAHSLTLQADGTARGWGFNTFGQGATGATATATRPCR
ncbi:MAG TPA: hypothetical protein VII06_06105 [Chloroflexota bacterium]